MPLPLFQERSPLFQILGSGRSHFFDTYAGKLLGCVVIVVGANGGSPLQMYLTELETAVLNLFLHPGYG